MQDTVYNRSNMTRIKIILWAALFTALLVSCGNSIQKPDHDDDTLPPLEKDEFYAQNLETGKYYKVKAEILYEGKDCVIWAEKGSGVTRADAKKIADEYDNKIRPTVVNAFSYKEFEVDYETTKFQFEDMLDFANWLVDGDDGRLTILLLDIKDGFNPPKIESYVAGYFYGGNFNPQGKIKGTVHYSNGRDMIYVDTNPGLQDDPKHDYTTQAYATFAHELQHLINFATTVLMRWDGKYYHYMDTWIDEGLSSQAEHLYAGKNLFGKYDWFNKDGKETIAKGNNFFVWDNHREEPDAILDDYATVYLFFRWLYLQASLKSSSNIFLKIETSNHYDYHAVIDVAKQINPAWDNWETLLRTWLAANYYPNSSYGYVNGAELQTIKVNPIAGSTISLYPGEGVYSIIKPSFSAGTSGNIHYAGLTETTINPSSPYTEKVLLTFNANTNNSNKEWSETGRLTGVTPPPKSQTMAKNIQTETITGPYVIDARDMLERSKR